MLELTRQDVFVDSVNTRAEKHGAETKVAFDIFFSIDMPNTQLGRFDKNLLSALFCKGDDPQADIDDQNPNYLPALRFPKIDAIKWNEKFPGYGLRIHHDGLFENEENPLDVLLEVEIDRFSFQPKEGGSVVTRFRAIAHPEAEQMAPILELMQQKALISATAPKPPSEILAAAGNLLKAEDGEVRSEFADAAAAAIEKHQASESGSGNTSTLERKAKK